MLEDAGARAMIVMSVCTHTYARMHKPYAYVRN
jgi:hypothetical protein